MQISQEKYDRQRLLPVLMVYEKNKLHHIGSTLRRGKAIFLAFSLAGSLFVLKLGEHSADILKEGEVVGKRCRQPDRYSPQVHDSFRITVFVSNAIEWDTEINEHDVEPAQWDKTIVRAREAAK